MQGELIPTIWRTCRALANRHRLRILAHLVGRPDLTVGEIARHERLGAAAASQYLRILNARGVLLPIRVGREVRYRVRADPTIDYLDRLLPALVSRLRRGLVDETFRILTAATHPRRVRLMQVLALRPMDAQGLSKTAGISLPATYRHLGKLLARRWVLRRGTTYRHCPSRDRLSRCLLAIILASPPPPSDRRTILTPCKV